MANSWNVTYEIVTPESAEHGDAEERGFTAEGVTLREALRAIGYGTSPRAARPAGLEDSGRWFSTCDSAINYRTGAETSYAIHPPKHITAASYARARAVLCGR